MHCRIKRSTCMLAVAFPMLLGALLAAPAQATTFRYSGSPFATATVTYAGTSIARQDLYDMQPSILYEPGAPGKPFKMWWLGQYNPGDADLAPGNLDAGDRIYFSESADGSSWSAPTVVLKGRGATSGTDSADDHLVGSPSVLHIGTTYYMFYEAYGKWMAAIDRFFKAGASDTLVTGAPAWNAEKGTLGGYNFETTLGFAPYLSKSGTIPIYSGGVTYPDGKVNSFLDRSTAACSQGVVASGTWKCRAGGKPVFWLYTKSGSGRVPIYSCYDTGFRNTFASKDPNCEGHGVPGAPDGGNYLLGYAAEVTPSSNGQPVAQTAPDMARANQNRVMLATSTDGVNWTRVQGAEDGGAVIAPEKTYTTSYPASCTPDTQYDLNRAYGSGYPSALERDGFLELYFTDDSQTPVSDCNHPLGQWRIRIPISQITQPAAYKEAKRQPNAPYGDDIKWSPARQRYFASSLKAAPGSAPGPGFLQSTMLVWSPKNPDPSLPPTFDPADSPQNKLFRVSDTGRLPTNWEPNDFTGRIGSNGGIASDGLGHTIDVPTADPNDSPTALEYSVFHLFYEAQKNDVAPSPFKEDLDHLVVFGYDKAPNEEMVSAPAISTWGPGRLDVWAVGPTDNALWHKVYAGNWFGWENRAGSYTSSPSSVSWGFNRIDTVIRQADNSVGHPFWANGWFYDSLGGNVTSAPAISSWGSPRLDVFARGTNSTLWHRYYAGFGWSGWEDLGGPTITSSPNAVSWGNNRIDIVARASDGSVHHVYWWGSGWASDNLGGNVVGAPAISSWGPNRLDVFARGTNNHLLHRYWGGSGWSAWEDLGGSLTSSPSAVSWGSGRIDIVARMTDNSIYHVYWDTNAWYSDNLGGANN
jgi:hypothetical protein